MRPWNSHAAQRNELLAAPTQSRRRPQKENVGHLAIPFFIGLTQNSRPLTPRLLTECEARPPCSLTSAGGCLIKVALPRERAPPLSPGALSFTVRRGADCSGESGDLCASSSSYAAAPHSPSADVFSRPSESHPSSSETAGGRPNYPPPRFGRRGEYVLYSFALRSRNATDVLPVTKCSDSNGALYSFLSCIATHGA